MGAIIFAVIVWCHMSEGESEAERAKILLSDDEAAEKAVDLAVAMLPRERNWINEWF